MKFWEGAILVVGGIWLVGRMSRNSAMHPANRALSYSQTPPLTKQTNVAQAPFVIAGESLTPPISIPGPVKQPMPVIQSNVMPVSNVRLPTAPAPITASALGTATNPIYRPPNMINKTIYSGGHAINITVPSYMNV